MQSNLLDRASSKRRRRAVVSDPGDAEGAARALATGATVAHAFANFYVITTRPDCETVSQVNVMKGRPADQVGSITTTPDRIPLVYDWSQLPVGLTERTVRVLMEALFALGPFGFRGPAASHIPQHMTYRDGSVSTAQVIAPGSACPSNDFLARSLAAIDEDILYITSCNRSRHLTGTEDEPAHYLAAGIQAEFGHEPGFIMLEHADEGAAREAYPAYAPMSTTILAFHKTAGFDDNGRPVLVMERHGGLHVEDLRPVLDRLGFALNIGPRATQRLLQRRYAPVPVGASR